MSVVGACLAVPRCVGVVVWQFTDKYSWVPSTFTGAGEACLYDQGFAKKPAWSSVSAQLAAAATAGAGANVGVGGGGGLFLPNASAAGVATASGGVARPTGFASAVGNGNSSAQPTSPSGPVQVGGSGRRAEGMRVTLIVALFSIVLSVFA